jgi:predicted Zn-dependent peptidase
MTTLPGAGLDERLLAVTAVQPASVTVPDVRLRVSKRGSAKLFALAGADRRSIGVRLYWAGGSAAEDARLAGLHTVTMQTLIRSPAPGGPLALAGRLESMGVAVAAGASDCAAYLELRGPAEYIHPALRLTAQAVAAAALEPDALRAARSAALHEVDQQAHDPARLAAGSFRAARAVPGSFLARRPQGTAEGLQAVTLADCQGVLSRLAHEGGVRILVVGDQASGGYLADVASLADSGADGVTGGATGQRAASVLRANPPDQVRAPGDGRARAYLLWGTAAETADVADHVAIEVAVHMLGGWSGSWLTRLFRAELGLTYTIGSSVTSLAHDGRTYCLAHVGMAVAAADLPRARNLLLDQVAAFLRYLPPPGDTAAAAVRLLRNEAHFHDATRKLISRTGSFLQAGLAPDFATRRIGALRAIDCGQFGDRVRAMARQPTLAVLTDAME